MVPWSSAPALQSNISISNRVSHDIRSAPPFRPSVASHFTRCLPFHSSFHLITVSNAMGRSLATFFWYQEEQSRASQLWPLSTLLHFLQEDDPLFPCSIREVSWVETITAYSCRSRKSSCCFLQTFLPQSWQAFLFSPQLLIPSQSVCHFLHLGITLPMPCPFSLLLLASPQRLGIFFQFLYHSATHTSQHNSGFRAFV